MAADLDVSGAVALVTGASRGVGRGVAEELDRRGARVYATGRTVGEADLPPDIERCPCDHTVDAETEAVVERVLDGAARSGGVVVAAELARELGFTDVDGSVPEPLTLEEA